jgi:hypothetical protein
MTTAAWVIHRIAGRLRLRVPDHKGDALFFATLVESARSLPGVLAARSNPLAASLVIEHEVTESGGIDSMLRTIGLELAEGEPPAEPPLKTLLGGVDAVERELRGVTGDAVDLRTIGFVALAAAALLQVARGNTLSAASSLLWHATDLLRDLPRSRGMVGPIERRANSGE